MASQFEPAKEEKTDVFAQVVFDLWTHCHYCADSHAAAYLPAVGRIPGVLRDVPGAGQGELYLADAAVYQQL